MQKSVEFSAPTVDRAIEKALQQLGLDRDSVSVEVLSMGKKGFLGLGASDAKIRVTFEAPDEVEQIREHRPEPKTEEKPVSVPRPAAGSADAPRLVKSAPKSEKPAPKPVEKKKDDGPKPRLVKKADGQAVPAEKVEKPVRAAKPAEKPAEQPETVYEPIVLAVTGNPVPEEQYTDVMRAACEFLNGLLAQMKIEGKAVVMDSSEEDHLRIELQGADMGPVIGRRGDTLDAIQYLTSLVINKKSEGHLRLTIDTENYRVKRAESLERHARKMAAKVVKYRKAMSLEPMNPYERRIVHSALQSFDGVTTHSTGTEPGRRIIISPVGAAAQNTGRKFDRRRGGRRRPSNKPQTESVQAPVQAENEE